MTRLAPALAWAALMAALVAPKGSCGQTAPAPTKPTTATPAQPVVVATQQEATHLIGTLDSLTEAYHNRTRYAQKEDRSKLNKYGFSPDFVPQYLPAEYEQRLKDICSLVPLDYNPYVQTYIDAYVVRNRELVSRVLGMQHIYFPIIEEAFEKEGLPTELKYLSVIESALNPRARSWCGALGLFQFMYGTALMYHVRMDSYVDERLDPYKASALAAKHLKDLYNIYHDWALVLAAYNCGPGYVTRAIRITGKTNFWDLYPYLPRETRGYVPSFIAAAYALNYATEHNIYPEYSDFTYQHDTISIRKAEMSLDHIARITHSDLGLLQDLNPALRLGKIPYSPSNYVLRVPRPAAEFVAKYPDSLYKALPKVEELPLQAVAAFGAIPYGTRLTYHAVKPGETLGTIAAAYHLDVRQLMAWNRITTTAVNVGQPLKVYVKAPAVNYGVQRPPAATPAYTGNVRYYKVQNGDTLWEIANRNPGISVQQIQALNGLNNFSRLQIGQVLKLPAL